MFTSLYLMKVLPASTPSAALKMMVMVGPSLMMRWIAMPMATTAAKSGIIQTMDARWRLFGTTVACGRVSRLLLSAISVLLACPCIPDQAGVEGFRGDHGQHNHCREKQHPRTGLHRHQRLELHEGDGKRVDEDVQHRPAADKLHQAIE